MQNIEVKSDQPMPSRGRGRPPIYPFLKMAVGDHFDLPLGDETFTTVKGDTQYRASSRVSVAAFAHTKRYPDSHFTVRTLPDEGVVRCWRIA